MKTRNYILGAGITGLCTGLVSGAKVFEAQNMPGGSCLSYYIRPKETQRRFEAPANGDAYRFSCGMKHMLFSDDPHVLRFCMNVEKMKPLAKRSSVFFSTGNEYIPCPIQNHLRFLHRKTAMKAIEEISSARGRFTTMKEWLEDSFGKTLCELFFYSYTDALTSGFYPGILPLENIHPKCILPHVLEGAFQQSDANEEKAFSYYPEKGMDAFLSKLAMRVDVEYGREVVEIDVSKKIIHFKDGTALPYHQLVSTLPLHRMMELTGLQPGSPPHPYVRLLILNLGGQRGLRCPYDHWLFVPDSKSGFHELGFYSNADPAFLPKNREKGRVSLYAAKSFPPDAGKNKEMIEEYVSQAVSELTSWEFIYQVEVQDILWRDPGYPFRSPHTLWAEESIRMLASCDIVCAGAYGRWTNLNTSGCIRDGMMAGASIRAV